VRLRTKHPQIPLYAVVEDVCASGGYYVAVAADKIFVDKASIVGSIGVLMDAFGFTGTMEKLGIERRLLTAGENKGFPRSVLAAGREAEGTRAGACCARSTSSSSKSSGGARRSPEGNAGDVQRPDVDRQPERSASASPTVLAPSVRWRAT
jgi:hypothetical protein